MSSHWRRRQHWQSNRKDAQLELMAREEPSDGAYGYLITQAKLEPKILRPEIKGGRDYQATVPCMNLDRTLYQRKVEVLEYYRHRAAESVQQITQMYAESQYKLRAGAVNKAVQETRNILVATLQQHAKQEEWHNEEILNNILILTHCCHVVMIESRNTVWPYEYMTFSRRIGELWEPFCKLCFEYPVVGDVVLFVPPLFDDVKKNFSQEIRNYIETLGLGDQQRRELLRYYDKVWSLVTCGEIKLELDLHFDKAGTKYIVDLKSGFSSNEKGNTNRLLLVASVYRNLDENYRCLIFVRSEEDQNNHYLQILKRSGIWEVFCGPEAYERIRFFSGFDIKRWIDSYIDWSNDFTRETREYLSANNLDAYLRW